MAICKDAILYFWCFCLSEPESLLSGSIISFWVCFNGIYRVGWNFEDLARLYMMHSRMKVQLFLT